MSIAVSRSSIRYGAAVLVAVLVAACGSSSSTTQPVNSIQQFKANYTEVRGALNQTAAAIGAELQRAPTQTDAQLAAAVRQLSNRWQSQISELQTFKPPPSLAADWDSVLDSANRVESDLTAVIAAADTHSQSAAKQAGASLVIDAGELKSAGATVKQKLGIK